MCLILVNIFFYSVSTKILRRSSFLNNQITRRFICIFAVYLINEKYLRIKMIGRWANNEYTQNMIRNINFFCLVDSDSSFQSAIISLYFSCVLLSNANRNVAAKYTKKTTSILSPITHNGKSNKVKIYVALITQTNKNARNSGFLSLAVLYIHW